MKHFGAQLAGLNNQVDGGEDSLLLVGANDTLVIQTPNTTGGQTLDGSVAGLVINSANGSSHVLGADGREIAISSLSTSVNTRLTIPIANAAADTFVDSALTQTDVSDGTQTVTAGGNVVITGDLQVNGTTTTVNSTTIDIADRYATYAHTDLTSDKAAIDGGMFVEHVVASGVATYAGIRVGADGVWEVTSNATTDDGTTGTWTDLGLSTGGIQSVQGGIGVEITTAGTKDGLTASAQSPVLSIDLRADEVSSSAATPGGGLTTVPAGASGELSIDFGGITAGNFATSIATTRTGLANGVAQQALVSEGNGGFTWANVGTVREFIARGTKATSTTFVSVPQATHGLAFSGGATTAEAFTVQVYEEQTNRISQILPEAIYIFETAVSAGAANGVPGEGAAAVGDVFVEFGATAAALDYRIIIKG